MRLTRTETAQLLGRMAALVIDTRTRRVRPSETRPVVRADGALIARIVCRIARDQQPARSE
jgi:hypothetical protein